MTICNMTIEGGGRAGMIAPDETTFEWVEGRPGAPDGLRRRGRRAGASCRPTTAPSSTPRSRSTPRRSRRWSPGAPIPAWWPRSPTRFRTPELGEARPTARPPSARSPTWRSSPGTPMTGDRARPRVHRLVHELADPGPARGRGRWSRAARSPARSGAMVVPGSAAGQGAGRGRGPRRGLPRRRLRLAHRRLLDVPGHEPGHPRAEGERCASTSNRNFEGRQGKGGRTHLVCPKMAAAAAIEGRFVDIRELGAD